jgi:F-type H+-transporting ATPase subunit delta
MSVRSLPSPKRYAQAILQIALEQDNVDGWLQELHGLFDITRQGAVATLLGAPGPTLQEKLEVIEEISPDTEPLAQRLLALLAYRRAVEVLPLVIQEYQALVDGYQSIQRVELTSAVPLDQWDKERITKQLAGALANEVRLQVRVDQSILGGLIIRVGDRLIDGSIRSQLEGLRRNLVEAVL